MAAYITVSDADAYLAANKLNLGEWPSLSSAEKTVAITMATTAIDRLSYKGDKKLESQENEFPRGSNTDVPDQIKNACCEIAYTLAQGEDLNGAISSVGVISRKFSEVSITYKPENVYSKHITAGILSYEAWLMLIPFLRDVEQTAVYRV